MNIIITRRLVEVLKLNSPPSEVKGQTVSLSFLMSSGEYVQMLERETKREKILEARQREMKLKERSRSEQSREDEAGRDLDGDQSPNQLITRADSDFYRVVEAEQRRRKEREEEGQRVRRRHSGHMTAQLLCIMMTSQ